MRATILKSKHVHLAGTATIYVVAELLRGTNYTIYTTGESLKRLRSMLPKVNICEYTDDFTEDPKERKLVLLPANNKEAVTEAHKLFSEATTCWTFSQNWKHGEVMTVPKSYGKEFVIVHCFNGQASGISIYGGESSGE